jgi:alpha-glucosidase (family GH31 glycosyl hydrolase)
VSSSTKGRHCNLSLMLLTYLKDQFLLGDGILYAPILEPDASTRGVVLPSGSWRDNDGSITEGPAEIVLDVRLESLPFWRRIRD